MGDRSNSLRRIRKGKILLINNNFFIDDCQKPRRGSDHDVQALEWIFKSFGFSITYGIDLTEEGIKHTIAQFKSEVLEGEEKCDMIVIAIMSHGTYGNSFFSSDNHKMSMDYIIKYAIYNKFFKFLLKVHFGNFEFEN